MQIFLAFSQKQLTTNNWISYPNDGNVNVSGQWCRGVSIRSENVRARRLEDVFRVVTLETLVPAKSIFTQWNVSFYEVRICEDQRKYFDSLFECIFTYLLIMFQKLFHSQLIFISSVIKFSNMKTGSKLIAKYLPQKLLLHGHV